MREVVQNAWLSSALQLLFDRLNQCLLNQLERFRKRKDVGDSLEKLTRISLTVKSLLNDAENKQINDEYLKEWLKRLRFSVDEADNLQKKINDEAARLESRREVSNSNCLTFSNKFLDDIMPKLKKITEKLDEFRKEIKVLGLQIRRDEKLKPSRLASTSLVDESDVFGRKEDKERIIKLLLSDGTPKNFHVISLVGSGGVGKTTLSQLVYNDDRVKSHFEYLAWVYVSDQFDGLKITRELLKESSNSTNFDVLQRALEEKLTGKKFLFVLDDVWSGDGEKCKQLFLPFSQCERGSKVIVTARNTRVAQIVDGEPFELGRLEEEHCRALFRKHAFKSADPNSYSELESIGKEIVRKCNGRPSSVRKIAYLLLSESSKEQWNKILYDDSLWELLDRPRGILH